MYVLQSRGCDQPNSETPMSSAAIARQDRFVANVGQSFNEGNAALSDLISALGGNASTVAVGDAGVPAGVISPSIPYVTHGTRVVRLPGWPGPWPVGGLFTGKNFAWPTAGGLMSPSSGFPAWPGGAPGGAPGAAPGGGAGAPAGGGGGGGYPGPGWTWPGGPGGGGGGFPAWPGWGWPGSGRGAGGRSPAGAPGSVSGGWPSHAGPRPGAFPPGPVTGPGGNFPTVFSAGGGGWPSSISAGGAGLLPSSFPCPGVAQPGGGAGAAVPGGGTGAGDGSGAGAAAGVSSWWALLLLLGAVMFVDGASKDGRRE